MTEARKQAPGRGLMQLWVMIAIFAAPFMAAWFFFLNPEYLPAGRSNKGEIINPVVPLSQGVALFTPEGEAFDPDSLNGKWTLLFLGDGTCGDDCVARLVDMRQIRLALGEGSLSVERLLLMTDPESAPVAAETGDKFPGMAVALTDTAGESLLLDSLGEGVAALGRVYIRDPMGNLMMRYAPEAPAEDTLKDMGLLLKASKNWVEGAQYGDK